MILFRVSFSYWSNTRINTI